jgi:hypothetical protein
MRGPFSLRGRDVRAIATPLHMLDYANRKTMQASEGANV